MDGDSWFDNVFAADRTYADGAPPPTRHLLFVSPGYFNTLGIPLIAGRDLTWGDTYNRVPVALISENFAREYWGTPAEAVGKRIRIATTDDWRQIVGVVGNVRDDGMDRPARTDVYWPALVSNFQSHPLRAQRHVTFVIRSPLAGSESLMKEVRQAVWSVDWNFSRKRLHAELSLYQSHRAAPRSLGMLGIAGAMALLLGTVAFTCPCLLGFQRTGNRHCTSPRRSRKDVMRLSW
jgi:hypothetical protein